MKCKNNTFVTINQILWLKLFISLVGQWVRQRITRICDNELTRINTNFFLGGTVVASTLQLDEHIIFNLELLNSVN